ncbi:MAG: glutaredoxin 3 [Pseudomonadota bacterium]
MAAVTIYTRAFCPYCSRAIKLLKKKGAQFNEIKAGMDAAKREEMTRRSGGGRTFPQILIGDVPIGGCDELHALESEGKLDAMLAG